MTSNDLEIQKRGFSDFLSRFQTATHIPTVDWRKSLDNPLCSD